MKESILGPWRIKQEDSGVVSIQHIDSFKRVEFGPYTTEKLVIKVYNGRSFEQVCVSLLAFREALNMLESKGDVVPAEAETTSEPEIDPDVQELVELCVYYLPANSEFNEGKCGCAANPGDWKRILNPCHVKTFDGLRGCEKYQPEAKTCDQPEKSGE